MAYAIADDVSSRLGRESQEEHEAQIVEARLADAELIIRSRIPDLDDMITDGKLLEAVVVMVESDAVLRLIRNPEGYTQETEGNYSYQVSARVASGRLDILDNEWVMLGVRRKVFTIAPVLDIPCALPGTHPDSDFGPQVPHDPNHPAVWWGE